MRRPSNRRGGSSRALPRGGTVTRALRWQARTPPIKKEISISSLISDECGVCVVRMPSVKNWAEFENKRLRQVVAELEVEINGSVWVTMAHARLPEDFESTVGATAQGQVCGEIRGGCVTMHPGVQHRDMEPFKDFLEGDDTVDGKSKRYRQRERRHEHQLSSRRSSHKIRVHANAANLNHRNDTCAVVFIFWLGPGANVTLRSMKCAFYC